MSQVEHILKMDSREEEKSPAKNFFLLMKPELTILSVFTSVCSAFLAIGEGMDVSLLTFLILAIGTFCVGGGSGALNQFLERHFDAEMKRTEKRPIPSGKIKPIIARNFGIVISLIGFIFLFSINFLTGSLSVVTSLSYLFLYTPLKRISSISTVVGAIPGALPVLIGWASIQNEISIKAITIFAVLFYWQAPHFYSLAWMYKNDYEKAGFRFLTIVDKTGKRVSAFVLGNLIALLIVSVFPLLIDRSGFLILASVVFAGLVFLYSGFQFSKSIGGNNSVMKARNLFFISLMYIPIYFSLLVGEKIF